MILFVETISLAHAVTKHVSDDPDILSFDHGQTVRIYSKSAGNLMYLWGGEVRMRCSGHPSVSRDNGSCRVCQIGLKDNTKNNKICIYI